MEALIDALEESYKNLANGEAVATTRREIERWVDLLTVD
jgi:hypothetical protein